MHVEMMNATKTAPVGTAEIKLDLIDESPTNPRKEFGNLEELAGDLKRHGLLQPVLVRPKGAKRFELVFGSRRFRASKLAGFETITATTRNLEDVEVLEIQIVENAKRLDIHPLEEADAYRALHETHGFSVEDLAAKVGKSLSHVYQRLKLCALSDEARRAFREGKLSPATAVLIARIPDAKRQKDALKEIITPEWNGEAMGPTRAADLIRDKYMLRLVDAQFDRGDASLVAGASACSACPKRTGNQKELFADVKSPDLCTDAKCFEAKSDAHWKKLSSEAAAAGQRVLSEKQCAKLFPYGSTLSYDADFVDLDAKDYSDAKSRTWRQILGKEAPDAVLARDTDGKIHHLIPKADASKALKEAGKKVPTAVETKSAPSEDSAAKKRREKEAVEREARKRAMGDIVEKAGTKAADGTQFWMVLVRGIVRTSWNDVHVDVCKRRELEVPKGKRADAVLLSAAKKMKLPELRGLALELVAAKGLGADAETFKEACALFRIIPSRHEKDIRAEKAQKAGKKS